MAGSKESASPARREAFRILLEIERKDMHADDLLRAKRISSLSLPDRSLCTTLVLGVLRWQIYLDELTRPLLARPNARLEPEVRIALRVGGFQLLFLDRIPAHAAIDESVALTKAAGHRFASGMVNAVLRKLAAKPKLSNWQTQEDADSHALVVAAHPAWLVERWQHHYGTQATDELCRHGQMQPELAMRLSRPELESGVAEQGIDLAPGELLTAARRILSGDPANANEFESGGLRIQDEGSQLIGELAAVSADAPVRILDCCAAPGGKTMILAERNPQAQIVALEMHSGRAEALRQRISAAASSQPVFGSIEVTQGDATALDSEAAIAGSFDLILADVPCSGTGTLGRNPEIRHRLHFDDLSRHHARQCNLLRSVLGHAEKTAAPGQTVRVVYSTCSLEPEENEEVVAEVLRQARDWQQSSLAAPIRRLAELGRLTPTGEAFLSSSLREDGSLLLLPGARSESGGRLETDGFFAALIERQF